MGAAFDDFYDIRRGRDDSLRLPPDAKGVLDLAKGVFFQILNHGHRQNLQFLFGFAVCVLDCETLLDQFRNLQGLLVLRLRCSGGIRVL